MSRGEEGTPAGSKATPGRRLGAISGVDWRPQAPADPGAGAAAAVALGGPVGAGAWTGRTEDAVALALAALLVVIPLPSSADLAERCRRLAVRGASVTVAGVYVALVGGRVWALVPAVTAATVLGAFLPRVGVTAPLGVLLVGLTGPVEAFGVPGLPQLAGCLWAGVLALPRWGRRGPRAAAPRAVTGGRSRAVGHAVRAGTLVAVSSAATAALGRLTGEGHWLVTGALLALTPTPEATRTKVRQRVVGNSLGGVAAAIALAFHPGPWAIALIVAVCSALAYALRPANYLYWCLFLPPLLLLLSDFDNPLPWYAAAVRAGLVLLGGLMAAVFARWRWPDTLVRAGLSDGASGRPRAPSHPYGPRRCRSPVPSRYSRGRSGR